MKVHLIEFDEANVYCKNRSWVMQTTHNLEEVTCKVCRALVDLEEGRIREIPFGGSYDANGNKRKNVIGTRWDKHPSRKKLL